MPYISRSELETIITRAADQQAWTVFSEDPRVVRKMTKLHGPGRKVGVLGWEWVVPKGCVSLRRPLQISKEERARRSQAARDAREAQDAAAL